MDVQIGLALIALLASIIALATPVYVIYLNNKNAKSNRLEDYARQDEVARRVEVTAARNASLIAEANAAAAVRDQVLGGKMDVLHTLGNSTLTAAMQVALDGMHRELLLMQHTVPQNNQAVADLKLKVDQLQKVVDARNKQADTASLKVQQAEAQQAGQAMNTSPPPMTTMPTSIGPVTEGVLLGDKIK